MFRNLNLDLSKEKLVIFVISPWVVALPISIIIIFFLPPIEKYKIEFVNKGVCDKPSSYVSFSDLDGDGYSEKIILFNNQRGDAAIKVLDQSGVLMVWCDFKGSIYKAAPISGDYDHDGIREIYFISNLLDSLFLNILYPTKKGSYVAKYKFVTNTHIKDRKDDYTTGDWQFCDLQLDGTDEVMFYVFAGYSLQPRRLFAYDLIRNTILAGPLMGCQTSFVQVQLDDDPYPEFLGQSSSTGNMPPDMDIPYRDSSSWLMALDHKLNFIFEPIEFKGHITNLLSKPIRSGNSLSIVSLFECSNITPGKPALLLHDVRGNLVKKKEIEKPNGQIFYSFLDNNCPNDNKISLINSEGTIYNVDSLLNLSRIGQIPGNCSFGFDSFDLDKDGNDEMVFLGNDFERIYIVRNDYSHVAEINISFERITPLVSMQENGKEPPLLFVQRGEREMWFSYGFNMLWFAKYPLWLVVYIIVLGFIHIIRRFQIIQQDKVRAREDRIAELQLEASNAYLDPHFTFNTLNSITSLIYKEERGKAHEIITRFTSLIRATLLQSGKVAQSLEDELDFVRSYLEIQQFRFGNNFSFGIKVETEVDFSIPVPKMLIQQHAENALKHGLKSKETGGRFDINVQQNDKTIIIVLHDNGIGREKAKRNNEPGTGKGLMTLEQIFTLFEKTHKTRITQITNDLMDDAGNPSGTEVILTIQKI